MKSIVIPFFIIILSGLAVYTYILPQVDAVKAAQRERGVYDTALNQAQRVIDMKESLQGKYNAFTSTERERIQSLLPDTDDVITSIINIDRLARDNAAIIAGVNDNADIVPEPERDEEGNIIPPRPGLRQLTSSYEISVEYLGFINFLSSLERSLKITDVTNISFSVDESLDDGSNLDTFSLTARNYWLSE